MWTKYSISRIITNQPDAVILNDFLLSDQYNHWRFKYQLPLLCLTLFSLKFKLTIVSTSLIVEMIMRTIHRSSRPIGNLLQPVRLHLQSQMKTLIAERKWMQYPRGQRLFSSRTFVAPRLNFMVAVYNYVASRLAIWKTQIILSNRTMLSHKREERDDLITIIHKHKVNRVVHLDVLAYVSNSGWRAYEKSNKKDEGKMEE